MTEGSLVRQESGVYIWGKHLKYDPDKRMVIRDDGEVQMILPHNEAVILESLLETPGQRVPYSDLYPLLQSKSTYDKINSSYQVIQMLPPLRQKIGDVNYGRDPRCSTYGIWRFINQWKDSPDGDTRPSSGLGGLLLLNRTADDVRSFLRSHRPQGPYWHEKFSIDF